MAADGPLNLIPINDGHFSLKFSQYEIGQDKYKIMPAPKRDHYRTFSKSQLSAILQRDFMTAAGIEKWKELIKMDKQQNSGGTGLGSQIKNNNKM